jgi:hypothetical protein
MNYPKLPYLVYRDEMVEVLKDVKLTKRQLNKVIVRLWNRKEKFNNDWSKEIYKQKVAEWNERNPDCQLMKDALKNIKTDWGMVEYKYRLDGNTFHIEDDDSHPDTCSSVWLHCYLDAEKFFELFGIEVNDKVSLAFSAIEDNKLVMYYGKKTEDVVNVIIPIPPCFADVYNYLIKHTRMDEYPYYLSK